MPVVTTGKVVCVVAAAAFVGAFRVHAGGDDASEAAGATLSGARASALKSDTVRRTDVEVENFEGNKKSGKK